MTKPLPPELLPEVDHVTYFPPWWLHNRAVVRKKGTEGPEYVLRRLRQGGEREQCTVQMVPVEKCADIRDWEAAAIDMTVVQIEEEYEPTGRIMSILRAPL